MLKACKIHLDGRQINRDDISWPRLSQTRSMTRDQLYDILSSSNCPVIFSLRISGFSSKVFRWLLLQTERLRDPKVRVDDTVKDVLGAPTKVQGSASKAIPSTTISTRYAENAAIACLEAAIPTILQIYSRPCGLDRIHPTMR